VKFSWTDKGFEHTHTAYTDNRVCRKRKRQ